MRVIKDYPPNIDLIDSFFHVKGKKIIYTWGDIIYSPHPDFNITPELYVHEGVHCTRQTTDTSTIEAWWNRYLHDLEFRLNEELLAHKAEYREFCRKHADRNQQNSYLQLAAQRLAGPTYGEMLSVSKARTLIKG